MATPQPITDSDLFTGRRPPTTSVASPSNKCSQQVRVTSSKLASQQLADFLIYARIQICKQRTIDMWTFVFPEVSSAYSIVSKYTLSVALLRGRHVKVLITVANVNVVNSWLNY